MTRNLTSLLLLLVFPAMTSWSQNPASPQLEDVTTEDAATQDSVELIFPDETDDSGAAFGSDETISVDFPDEEIRTILRNVADLYDLNLVIPDTLQGRTSLKLRNVTWQEVFDVVLEPIGFTYIIDRSIIKVRSLEDLAAEPVDTRVFLINYADAEEIQNSVGILIDSAAGGRIQVDTRSNALVITERPSRMNRIQEIIERLDRPTEQVMIESKFIEVTNRDAKNIGVNWSSLSGHTIGTGPFRETNDRVITNDSTDASDPSQFFKSITETTTQTTTVLDVPTFEVVLSALNTLDDVKLVSNPTVVAMNNTEALISIGERFPVPAFSYNEERGTFEVSGFDFTDIGINLDVTPQVNSAGFINLNIRPEVSIRQGTVGFGGAGGAEIPIIGSRRTESNITIKDGFTLAIGGLVESQIINNWNKVPLLGDIPGLGQLFRSKADTMEQRNLIIFITAKTLNPDGSTYEEVIDPRILNEMGITDRDVPGYEVPESEREMLEAVRQRREEFFEDSARQDLNNFLEDIEEGKASRRTNMGKARY